MSTTKRSRPQRIERVRQRLERWRRTRAHPRSPIPNTIWAGAVAVARQQGLYQTARALHIDYGALKEHLEGADRAVGADTPSGFVELARVKPTALDDCVIEVDGPRTTLRIRLRGVGLPDLARLSRAVAGVDA